MQLSVIDVSEHQGNINWEKVKNAGVVGAMIRTGYGVKDPNQIDKWFYNCLLYTSPTISQHVLILCSLLKGF